MPPNSVQATPRSGQRFLLIHGQHTAGDGTCQTQRVASQAQGFIGSAVDRMIRRDLRRSFHTIGWVPPATEIPSPAIFVPNHHGWHDGYLMYVALTRLGIPFVDWIAEYDSFPFFGKVGGMPFPPNDSVRRAATIKKTIRLMRQDSMSLLLFAERDLHRPPMVAKLGESLEFMSKHGEPKAIVPVAIRYEMGMHQRPEAYVEFGTPVEPGLRLGHRTKHAIAGNLDRLISRIRYEPDTLSCLQEGTLDISERWDFAKLVRRR